MDVVDAIAKQPTGNRAGHGDVPREDILIDSVTRIEA
jgi:peptidyl-prolyl cis-trans isomerase B (cyclophilin B)